MTICTIAGQYNAYYNNVHIMIVCVWARVSACATVTVRRSDTSTMIRSVWFGIARRIGAARSAAAGERRVVGGGGRAGRVQVTVASSVIGSFKLTTRANGTISDS